MAAVSLLLSQSFENGQIALLLPKIVDLHITQKVIDLCYFKNCMPFFFQTSKSGTTLYSESPVVT